MTCIHCGLLEIFDARSVDCLKRQSRVMWACWFLPHRCMRCAYERSHPRANGKMKPE